VLQFTEAAKPIPKTNEVLGNVRTAADNPTDWHLMRGIPFFVRFEAGFPKPKNPILGVGIAGQVEAVGSTITQFQPGDEVFEATPPGGFAEAEKSSSR
jgi:NADPH:quinone reductase-like Zn-dependent oxidoreductase